MSAKRGLPLGQVLGTIASANGHATLMERTPSITPGAVWSRAATRVAESLSADNIPIDTIRKGFGVGWNTVMRALLAAADLVSKMRPIRVGIDETVMITGRLTTRRRQFLAAMVCLDTSLAVAVVQGRDTGFAKRLLGHHAPDEKIAACDLISGYKSACRHLGGRDRGGRCVSPREARADRAG